MAVSTALSTQIYGTLTGASTNKVTSTPTYPTWALPVGNIAAVKPYVDAGLGISSGALVVFKDPNMNVALESGVVINETVADFLSRWNA